MNRASGVLLPVFSLPSKYGIGCISKEAYQFVDQLREAGQSYWQILPLGPTGYGDSPYQSFSTYAGNPYFIDLETLVKEGLLTKKECKEYDFGDKAEIIDYEKIYYSRFKDGRIIKRDRYRRRCRNSGCTGSSRKTWDVAKATSFFRYLLPNEKMIYNQQNPFYTG